MPRHFLRFAAHFVLVPERFEPCLQRLMPDLELLRPLFERLQPVAVPTLQPPAPVVLVMQIAQKPFAPAAQLPAPVAMRFAQSLPFEQRKRIATLPE